MNEMSIGEKTAAKNAEAFTLDQIVVADAIESCRKDLALTILVDTMTLNAALAHIAAPRTPIVGDILVCSWGYNQTNIDYYQVIAVTASSVRIREIGAAVVRSTEHHDYVAPVAGNFIELKSNDNPKARSNQIRTAKGVTKRVNHTPATATGRGLEAATYSVKISSYASARLWDGDVDQQTGAAYGH